MDGEWVELIHKDFEFDSRVSQQDTMQEVELLSGMTMNFV